MDSHLFITNDKEDDNVYYIRTTEMMFARLKITELGFEIYFYKYKFSTFRKTINLALKLIENSFKRYYKCVTQ